MAIDLTGQIFSRLTVLSRASSRGGAGYWWKCRCVCGRTTVVRSGSLRSAQTTSCGCWRAIAARQLMTKHGLKGSPIYRAWNGMRDRCLNKNNPNYGNYGGRGIAFCKAWESPVAFAAWARANGFQKGLFLDRKNVDGNYSPRNCQWIPRSESNDNKTTTIRVQYRGKKTTLAKAARLAGVNLHTAYWRLRQGNDPFAPMKERLP